MDYNDNDYQSHLAGEDSSKVSSVLHPYALPKFEFDDSLQGHLRFDSLVENEVFLGIPSQEDNQWIEDFSRGSSGIEFSSSAADSCSIPRRNNVWSEATSTESVEMLLKSVGQEEMVPGDAIMKESDAGNELSCLFQPVESSSKLDNKRDIKESSSAAPTDESDKLAVTSSGCGKTVREGSQITDGPDNAGERCSGVNTEEKSQTEIESAADNLAEAKTSVSGSLSDKPDRHPSPLVTQSSVVECLADSLPVSLEKLDTQHNLTVCHSGNTSDFPSDHHITEDKQISVSKESSMGDRKVVGGVDSETCTSDTGPLSSAASVLEVVKELQTETRTVELEESCKHILTAEGCKEDASSVEPPEVSISVRVFSKSLEDNQPAEGNIMRCEAKDASGSQHFLETSDTENPENGSSGQIEKVSASEISDGLNTLTEKEENNLDSYTPPNLSTTEACTLSEISDPSKTNNGVVIHSPEGPSNKPEESVSAELIVKKPVADDLENGNDADRVSKGDACAGDHVSLSVPAGSMDICGESLPRVVDIDATNEDVLGGKKKEEVLPIENEMGRSSETDHGVRSSRVGEEPEISDQGHELQSESSALNKQALNPGFVGSSLISGGKSVTVPFLSGSGSIATEVVDYDEKLKPLSIKGGSVDLAEKKEMEVVLSVEAEDSTSKESSELPIQLGPLSTDGKDASGDCYREIAPVKVDQKVSIKGNLDTASYVEQAAIAETNNECSRYVEVRTINIGSTKEGDGAEGVALEKNQETKVGPGKFRVVGSSDVLESASAAVISSSTPSSNKTTESVSRAVVENAAPLVDTVEIGGKAQSASISSGENASTNADKSFTFDVSPLIGIAKGEVDKSITSTQASKLAELKAEDVVHLTSGRKQTDTKAVQETSIGSPLVPDRGTSSGGAKGGERRAKRGSGRSGKEKTKKGNQVKETSSLKQSDRGDKSCGQLSSSVVGQNIQSGARTVERNIAKSSGVVSFPTSHFLDLNTSSPASVLFHQPFTDLQQVQLRAQIFVYGSLIQGAAPDEACMVSAFGTSEGARSLWDPAWRACVERIRGQRSHTGNNETPSHPRSGPRTPDQANKQAVHQNKVTTSAAGRAGGKATSSPAISTPIIPLSSPLWNMPTPSCDGLPSNGMARGAVIDYKALSPMHPYQTPPAKSYVGHTASWLPQAPFPGPWVTSPQTSAFDIAKFPAFPVSESVKLTSSFSVSAGAKHAPTVSVAHTGDSGVLAGTSLHDNKKAAALPPQHSADQKSRKRKKASSTEDRAQKSLRVPSSESVPSPAIGIQLSSKGPASDDFVSSSVAVAPLVDQSQIGHASAPIVGGHFSTSVVITPSPSSAPKSKSDTLIISTPSSTDPSEREINFGKKGLSPEDLSKVEESKLQAEEAAANAASAVSHCQEVWSQLEKHKNSHLVSDIEVKLTSAAVAIAAASSVAKAAAAAAKIASNAALQAKLMADEALMAWGTSNPSQTSAVSFPNVVNNLGSATPASILKGWDVSHGSGSIISVAREAAKRRIEAASAASRHAENMNAIVKAAELAADAVSHAGKVVAMADPLPLSQLVEAGPDSYWKNSEVQSEQGVKDKKVNGDESNVSIVEKNPGVFSMRSQGPSSEEMHPMEPAGQPTGVSGNVIPDSVGKEEVISPTVGVDKDLRSAKGHSTPEVSKNVDVIPESKNDSRLASHDVEACEDVARSKIQEGSLVEVSKDSDDGKRAWYSAKVLSSKNGKALVCYTDHQSDEGSEQLKEWVPLDTGSELPRIRPAHPVTAPQGAKKRRRAAVKDYTWYVGDRVDAWIDYRWREGVIAEKNKRDETTFSVNFPAYGDTAVVRAWHLRPTLVWKDGEWVEWSRSRHDFLSQGDTPKEKRMKLNPAIENTENVSLSKKMDSTVPGADEPETLLPLSINDKTFNIGSNKDANKPNTLRTMRSGLQKEGSKVFGVPKPGKKRKFMEVSKHYVSDRETKSNVEHGSAKFTKYLMPQATGAGGWKAPSNSRTDLKDKQVTGARFSRTDLKDKQVTGARRRPPKPNKLPSSTRNLKDNSSTSTGDASVADHASDAIEYNKNEPQQPNVVDFASNAGEGAEGPLKVSSEAVPANVLKKASTSRNREEGMKKKTPVSNLKSSKVEEKDKLIPDANEPTRRSNRRIQPTSRLLEGIQSSLIISKLPSVSHDKGRGHSRGASR